MSAKVGLNRINWDIRYDDPPAFSHSWEINANPGDTPASPEGPLALPGVYTVRLTVDGKGYSQTVTVRDDPRSPATPTTLREGHALVMKMYKGITEAWDGYHQATGVLATLAADTASSVTEVATAAKSLTARIDSVAGSPTGGRGFFRRGGPRPPPSFVEVNGSLVRQLNQAEQGDGAPTPADLAAYAAVCTDLSKAVTAWRTISEKDVVAFNAMLTKNNLTPVSGDPPALVVPSCGAAKGGATVKKAHTNGPEPDEDHDPDQPPE
jgi:hypothetical protein